MSVDHKVFVCCGKDKALDVYGAVQKALTNFFYQYVTELCRKYDCDSRWLLPEDLRKELKCPKVTTHGFEHFWLGFSTEKESRDIFMTHSCSYDYGDTHEGDKIIFSIGHWGDHQVYMDLIKETIKPFGDVFEDVNDCDDIYFEKVE